jgi:peroxiredoxin (alkyl hydroperoxide reductase subunit C)
MNLKKGDVLPDANVFIFDGSPKETSIKKIIGEERAVIFGLPGAFTPTCSAKHLPGFIGATDLLKTKNIKKVVCISVNDPFVMNAWGKENNVGDKIIMMADPFLNFTKAIGAEVDKSERGLGVRSNRYTMFVNDMEVVKLQEEQDTGSCEISAAENFLKLI